MEYLAFVNGRNQDEKITIFEGEMYEIDRLTVSCIDSNEIRNKYKKKFEQFQTKYPNAKNGSVRIYGKHVYSENGNRVLYKKHKVAFNHIIKDTTFLRWFGRKELAKKPNERIIYDTYILRGIADFSKELIRIKQFLTNIKQSDRKDTNLRGGAARYYRFMRILLSYYEEFSKTYNHPSIDDIWKTHLQVLEHHKLQKSFLGEPISAKETEAESDRFELSTIDTGVYEVQEQLGIDELCVFEEPLYDFFANDYFERYYSQLFIDDYLMVVGNVSLTKDYNKLQPWIDITETCFNGNVHVGFLEQFNSDDIKIFNSASIIIIYSEEETEYFKKTIINALHNKSEVVFISEDRDLLLKYAEKFKNLITILDSDIDKHLSAKKQLINYFVEKYQLAKGHQK